MVINGFSLRELRRLFLDELYEYHDALFFTLEQTGVIKEGSYAKINNRKKDVPVEDTINQLRKQLFKTISKK